MEFSTIGVRIRARDRARARDNVDIVKAKCPSKRGNNLISTSIGCNKNIGCTTNRTSEVVEDVNKWKMMFDMFEKSLLSQKKHIQVVIGGTKSWDRRQRKLVQRNRCDDGVIVGHEDVNRNRRGGENRRNRNRRED